VRGFWIDVPGLCRDVSGCGATSADGVAMSAECLVTSAIAPRCRRLLLEAPDRVAAAPNCSFLEGDHRFLDSYGPAIEADDAKMAAYDPEMSAFDPACRRGDSLSYFNPSETRVASPSGLV
jgi:hypothetical protein